MEELLHSLGLSDKYPAFLLVGHSMGGLVACEFAAHNKSSVSSLVLFNCAGTSHYCGFNDSQIFFAGLPVKIAPHKYATFFDCILTFNQQITMRSTYVSNACQANFSIRPDGACCRSLASSSWRCEVIKGCHVY